MRLPNRKPGKYTFAQFDPVMTAEKFRALQERLEHLKTVSQPRAIKDTKRFAENGDFSENAEYQIAKGRLRGINRAIDELQHQITHAQLIEQPTDTTTVQIGHTVTLGINDEQHTFHILGPTETDPARGIISYKSPMGAAILGKKIDDVVEIQTGDTTVRYTIVDIR